MKAADALLEAIHATLIRVLSDESQFLGFVLTIQLLYLEHSFRRRIVCLLLWVTQV